ncbi:hypothetical protein HDU82_001580 [Entophlyctis luteolus]|nr:hypothetical protein HDU82_001580 [Entophlyctis luteolus]
MPLVAAAGPSTRVLSLYAIPSDADAPATDNVNGSRLANCLSATRVITVADDAAQTLVQIPEFEPVIISARNRPFSNEVIIQAHRLNFQGSDPVLLLEQLICIPALNASVAGIHITDLDLVISFENSVFAVADISSLYQAIKSRTSEILKFSLFLSSNPSCAALMTLSLNYVSNKGNWSPAVLDASPAFNSPTASIDIPQPPRLRFLQIGSAPFISVITSKHPQPDSSSDAMPMNQLLAASVENVSTTVASLFSYFSSHQANYPQTPQKSQAQAALEISNLNTFLELRDSTRSAVRVVPNPKWPVVAILDSWGRILFFEGQRCEVVHVLKGYRDVHMVWTSSGTRIAVLSSRGIFEVWAISSRERKLFLKPSSTVSSSSAFLVRLFQAKVSNEWELAVSCETNSDDIFLINGVTYEAKKLLNVYSKPKVIEPVSAKEYLLELESSLKKLTNEGDFGRIILMFRDLKDVRLQAAVTYIIVIPTMLKTFQGLHVAAKYLTFFHFRKLSEEVFASIPISRKEIAFSNSAIPSPFIMPKCFRPFCAAVQDIWAHMVLARILHELHETDVVNLKVSKILPYFYPKKEGNSKLKISIKLQSDCAFIANLLYSPVFSGNLSVEKWVETIFGGRELDAIDLAYLLLEGSEVESADFTVLKKIIAAFCDGTSVTGGNVFHWIIQRSWKTGNVARALKIISVMDELRTEKSLLLQLSDLISRLTDCDILCTSIDSSIMREVNAGKLNESEMMSVPTLIARHEAKIYPTEISRATFNKITSHFPVALLSLLPLYQTYAHADEYARSPTSFAHLQAAVNHLELISHPTLANGLALYMFDKIFARFLRTLVDMVDRNRKCPTAAACARHLGAPFTASGGSVDTKNDVSSPGDISDDANTTVSGLLLMLDLLLRTLAVLVIEDGCAGVGDMCADLREVLGVFCGGFNASGTGDDGAVGDVVRCLRADGGDAGVICSVIVREQVQMARVLRTIVEMDLKLLRPSRMFGPDVLFGRSLFVAGGYVERIVEGAEVERERELFAKKAGALVKDFFN